MLYSDGSLIAGPTSTASVVGTTDSPYPLYLGRSGETAGQYMRGVISDVAIWDRALSDAEIAEAVAALSP